MARFAERGLPDTSTFMILKIGVGMRFEPENFKLVLQ